MSSSVDETDPDAGRYGRACGANLATISENHRGGAVPWFEHLLHGIRRTRDDARPKRVLFPRFGGIIIMAACASGY